MLQSLLQPQSGGPSASRLTEKPGRKIYVADNSQAMIDTGMDLRPRAVTARRPHPAPAYALALAA